MGYNTKIKIVEWDKINCDRMLVVHFETFTGHNVIFTAYRKIRFTHLHVIFQHPKEKIHRNKLNLIR